MWLSQIEYLNRVAKCECECWSDRGPGFPGYFREGAKPLGREQLPTAMGHVGSGLQVLIRWRGSGHEDEWKPYAQCNPPSQGEAKAIERIKLPARGIKRAVPASLAQVLRASARFAPMGGGEAKRLRMSDGRALRPRVMSPAVPTYSPAAGPFGEGGGRSQRGLPILWEPPSGGDMRG